jgi:hypothetical protein
MQYRWSQTSFSTFFTTLLSLKDDDRRQQVTAGRKTDVHFLYRPNDKEPRACEKQVLP